MHRYLGAAPQPVAIDGGLGAAPLPVPIGGGLFPGSGRLVVGIGAQFCEDLVRLLRERGSACRIPPSNLWSTGRCSGMVYFAGGAENPEANSGRFRTTHLHRKTAATSMPSSPCPVPNV